LNTDLPDLALDDARTFLLLGHDVELAVNEYHVVGCVVRANVLVQLAAQIDAGFADFVAKFVLLFVDLVQDLHLKDGTVVEVLVEILSCSFYFLLDSDVAGVLALRVSVEVERHVFLLAPEFEFDELFGAEVFVIWI